MDNVWLTFCAFKMGALYIYIYSHCIIIDKTGSDIISDTFPYKALTLIHVIIYLEVDRQHSKRD